MQKQLNIYYNLYLLLEKSDKTSANIVKQQMLQLIPAAEKQAGCGLLYEGINA